MSASETIRIAHSARCKLKMAAGHPDRNFRLILGHALTLDKLLLRVAEIESDGSSDGDEEGVADEEPSGPRRVSFSSSSRARHDAVKATTAAGGEGHHSKGGLGRRSSPPPSAQHFEHDDDAVEDDDEDIEDDDDDAGALSLQRFPSASAQPPRMIPDNDGIDDDEDELNDPVSPPSYTPSEDELKKITEGATNPALANQYNNVVRCTCSKSHAHAPKVSNVWELPGDTVGSGLGGKRRALVQVEA